MTAFFLLIRPHQWLKNLFVFLPIFFAGELGNIQLVVEAFFSFMAFSFIASAIYCLNDIIDVEDDRKHHSKKNRPIASGKISKKLAVMIAISFVIASFSIIGLLSSNNKIQQTCVIIAYLVINVMYCFWVKKIAIIDVMFIATGFVLRLVIGGLAVDIELTNWIIMMTFLLALFMGFAKRRDDVVIKNESGIVVRENISKYNVALINQLLCMLASITIVCYIMYTMSIDVINRFNTSYLYLTTVFVIAGITRYMQLSLVEEKSGSPTKILMKDRFIQVSILLWVVTFYVFIYL